MPPSGQRQAVAESAEKSRRKTKTGCRTCKVRRVKCDEGRPACQRCITTGRVCDGYGIWGGGGNAYGTAERTFNTLIQQRAQPSRTPGMLPGLSPQEGEAFQFFRTRTAVKLPGIFGSDFWESLVLQLSLREPAVLHAVLALAATHRRGVTPGQLHRPLPSLEDVGPVMDPNERLALQQYNKAISHLRCHLESGEAQSLRITLASCVVFTCIELLKGDIQTSQAHFRIGWRLLGQINAGSGPNSTDEHLSEAFTRISIQPPAFGQGSEYADMTLPGRRDRPSSQFPSVFGSMKEARRHLDWLLHDIHLLSAEANAIDSADDGQVPTRLVHQQRHLQQSASSWLRALLTSTPRIRARCPDNEKAIRLAEPLLRLYHRMASIMVATSLRRTDETVFDAHTPDFAAILEATIELWAKAADLLPSPSRPVGNLGFTADMGFIPPLYYTALKCRVPRLRRYAVHFLALSPHREGLWDATLAVAVARKVFELEERDFYSAAGIIFADEATSGRDKVPLDDVPLVPGEARINDVQLLPPGMGGLPDGTAALVCNTHTVGRGWETRTVEFRIEPDRDSATLL